ncbi:MAG: hypothetical protein ABJH07_15805 [Sedimentitalea sp.]|uniref:hypothetical protein n=1 Tax=Sedimentitalea sp. TaxID=2048915 RepID=UPI003263A245
MTDCTVDITTVLHTLELENALDAHWAQVAEFIIYTVIAVFLVVNPPVVLIELEAAALISGSLCIASTLLYSWVDKPFARYEHKLAQK